MHADPSRRYQSAQALDDDLHNYLDGLPVRAQRDWAGYRVRKFVLRNKGATAASALALAALLAGAFLALTSAHRARTEQIKATQANVFLRQLLASVHPETGSRDAKVSEVLDAAAQRIDRDFATRPDIRAELETVIGESYEGLGRYDDAERLLRASLRSGSRPPGRRAHRRSSA